MNDLCEHNKSIFVSTAANVYVKLISLTTIYDSLTNVIRTDLFTVLIRYTGHGCTSYTFTVDKQGDERNITLQIHNNFNANNDKDECTIYWGDGKSDEKLVVEIGNPQRHYYTQVF